MAVLLGLIADMLFLEGPEHRKMMSMGGPLGSLLWRLRLGLVGDQPDGVLYECRQCGRTMEGRRSSCPDCGATDVARYEL